MERLRRGHMDLKLVADGNAAIGTGRSADGQLKSAWIIGWDPAEKRMIHEWFGDTHGRANYEIVDDKALRGPGTIHGKDSVTKGTVTLTRKSDKIYVVRWSEATVNGENSDEVQVTVEKE